MRGAAGYNSLVAAHAVPYILRAVIIQEPWLAIERLANHVAKDIGCRAPR